MAIQTQPGDNTQTRGRPKRSHLLARKTAPSFRVGETLLLRGVTRRCFDVRVVEGRDVPLGPWRSYGEDNHFVIANRQTEQRQAEQHLKEQKGK